MNTKSKLKAISIGIAAIMMVSLLAAVTTVSASPSVDVTDCWIGDDNKVYFTIYSDAKAEGHMCLNVDGAYQERKKYTLNAGETTTLSFRQYRWNGVDDVEVCVDCVDTSCCTPLGPTPTPTPPLPDLKVEKTVEFVDGGFIVHYKVTNIGDGGAGTSEICKSVDDVCTEVKTVPALGANGGFYCGDFDLETCQPGEDFKVTVCADCTHIVDESNENNNCEDNYETCPTPTPTLPDLKVEKTVEFVDGGFIVHYKVTNIGDGGAGTSEICKSVDDVCTEVETVPALGANGGFYCGDFDLETCQPGEDFKVTVCADCTHIVDESNENNNCEDNYETCPTPTLPDLKVEKTVEFVDGGFIVHYKVTNIGGGEAGTSEICKSVDDVCTEVKTVPALGANGGFYCGDFDLETCQPGEDFKVTVCADCTHIVDESNENNNCEDNYETCPTPTLPDLKVEKTVEFVDGGFIVHYKVTNIGGVEAGTSEICKSVDDVCTEVETVPALGANGGFYCGDFDLETCQPGEDFKVTVCADCTHIVDESNENNNCEDNYETCPDACMPDLKIVNKTEEIIGDQFIVHYRVMNIGCAPAGASTTGKYIDPDCPHDTDLVPALNPGEDYCGEFAAEDCPACGESIDITVCADIYDVVTESNENNNCETNTVICEEAVPGITVTKTVWDGSAWVDEIDAVGGDVVTFQSEVINSGICCPLTDINVEDTLPACLEYIVGSANPAPDSVTYLRGDTVLTWSELGIFTIDARVVKSEDCCGEIPNKLFAEATAKCTGETVSVSDIDTAKVNSVAVPGMEVIKTVRDGTAWVDVISVPAGTDVTFNSTVRNSGNCCDLVHGTVWDILPRGLTYNSANPAPDVVENHADGTTELVWWIGPLEPDDSMTYIIDATATGRFDEYINTQEARMWAECTGTLQSDIDTATVFIAAPDIEVTKTANPTEGEVGDEVTFTIDVTNTGDYSLNPVTVVDTLAGGLTYVSDDYPGGSTVVGQVITWDLGTMQPGDSTTIHLVAQIRQWGRLWNDVDATGTPPTGAAVTDWDRETVTRLSASIWINKIPDPWTGPFGTNVDFTIEVTNNGDTTLDGVIVTDWLPVGLRYISDNSGGWQWPLRRITWNLGTMQPGDTTIIHLVAQIRRRGWLPNFVYVGGTSPAGYYLDDDVTVSVLGT